MSHIFYLKFIFKEKKNSMDFTQKSHPKSAKHLTVTGLFPILCHKSNNKHLEIYPCSPQNFVEFFLDNSTCFEAMVSAIPDITQNKLNRIHSWNLGINK